MIYSATFALALFLTQTARALPQPGSPSMYPASSTEATSYSSTPSPYSSPYSTTEYYPKTTDDSYSKGTPYYTPSSYAPKESYPPGASDDCQCYPTPMPYPSMDKRGDSYSSSYYPTTTSNCPCYSSTPYPSSKPSYTSSSYPSPKETYPPTTPYPSNPPTKPSDGNKNKPEPSTPSSTLRATYDTTYDNKSGSMNGVACSNGPNGLAARFPTFGDVPSFPFIGGAFDVVWNSPNCGACWNLTNVATGVSISLTAVDSAGAGFNIAQEAFEKLNNGQIGSGVLDVVANKISPSVCGL